MSSSGRGRLFLEWSGDESSSGTGESDQTFRTGIQDIQDSGISSKTSSGEFRRTGRGKLLEELALSCASLSINHGRTSLYKPTGTDTSDSPSLLPKKSLGRGSLFSGLVVEKNVTTKTAEKPKTEKPIGVAAEKFFQPSTGTTVGSEGTKVPLVGNYIQLQCEKEMGVYMYEVRFVPNVDCFDSRFKYLNEHADKLGRTRTFDGIILYLPILLENNLVTYVSKSLADGSDIEVRIMFKKKQALKDCIHLYNLLFNKVMKALKYVQFDRKQFDPTAPKMIPQAKLEVWPGYVTAVDEYDGGLMLCCDVSHRLLCQTTVLDFLGDINIKDKSKFEDNAKRALLGSVVITRYNNRTYRIDDIYFQKSPKSTFQYNKQDISYTEYYKKNYNIQIKNQTQPLLAHIKTMRKSRTNETEEIIICLVPELCYLTGLRDEQRSDLRLMREIASYTRVSPNQRLAALHKFHDNVMNSAEARQVLKNWGLSLKGPQYDLTGRLFREEQISFAKRTISAGPNADFNKYATSNEMLEVVNLRNWTVFHCRNNTKEANSFCEHMQRAAGALGIISYYQPKRVVLDNDRVDTYVNALRANITSETQIVVCICPTSRDDRYAAIKKLCCSEIPVASQVINGKTLSNDMKNRSICQKIALQMNCKLGGTLWSVKIPFKSVMICGIDSYHDPGHKGNSVGAFVASLNNVYTKWYSQAIMQTRGEEIVGGLCSAFIAALHAYKKHNHDLPQSVIIYRDGVGDGQLPLCSNYEVPQFENAVRTAFGGISLKLTFIIVQKRINTKFYKPSGGNVDNPQPGTVVDHSITRRNMYDFFLVSQNVRQGTVSPTHFIVLKDDSDFSPDIIQRLSYKLCFMYYNWPGTIRIPACCQYAHKMAYLIGQSVRRLPSEKLLDKLFYL